MRNWNSKRTLNAKKKFRTEQTKLELEQYKLHLIKEGKWSDSSSGESVGPSETHSPFDFGTNLRLLPNFSERDPDMFFT